MDLGGVDVAGSRGEPHEGDPLYGLYQHKQSFGGRVARADRRPRTCLRPDVATGSGAWPAAPHGWSADDREDDRRAPRRRRALRTGRARRADRAPDRRGPPARRPTRRPGDRSGRPGGDPGPRRDPRLAGGPGRVAVRGRARAARRRPRFRGRRGRAPVPSVALVDRALPDRPAPARRGRHPARPSPRPPPGGTAIRATSWRSSGSPARTARRRPRSSPSRRSRRPGSGPG